MSTAQEEKEERLQTIIGALVLCGVLTVVVGGILGAVSRRYGIITVVVGVVLIVLGVTLVYRLPSAETDYPDRGY